MNNPKTVIITRLYPAHHGYRYYAQWDGGYYSYFPTLKELYEYTANWGAEYVRINF